MKIWIVIWWIVVCLVWIYVLYMNNWKQENLQWIWKGWQNISDTYGSR